MKRLFILAVCYSFFLSGCAPGPDGPTAEENSAAVESTDQSAPTGLRLDGPGAAPGYVLFTPLTTTFTYLVDAKGQVVHLWESNLPGTSPHLLDNGNLLRSEKEPNLTVFPGTPRDGRIREYTWDGELVWDFLLANERQITHHDTDILPNGNVLAIVYESKSAEGSRKAGRRPSRIPEAGLWPDAILELEPKRPDGARIVWEWHAWDHLIQNTDESLDHFGDPSAHPERININGDVAAQEISPEELEQLKALGYVPEDTKPEDLRSDLFHTNAVNYNARLDQIVMSAPRFDEIWIIDHSTTTKEAAGSSGGRWGRGGDLLYRWGNALAYDRARNTPKQFYGGHDARFIPEEFPGGGHIMVFNNNLKDENGKDFSAVYEIAPPVDASGHYIVPQEGPFGPPKPLWTYTAPDKVSFFSTFISSAHRLSNGNTFICSGAQGRFFEVTPEGEIVWEYWSPYSGKARPELNETPRGVFRATKIPPDHPALAGRELKPLDPQPTP
jgi:hypothetical protein